MVLIYHSLKTKNVMCFFGYLDIFFYEVSESFAHFSIRLSVFSYWFIGVSSFFLPYIFGYETFVEYMECKYTISLPTLWVTRLLCFYFNKCWSWATKLISWPVTGLQPTIWSTLWYTIMQSFLGLNSPERGISSLWHPHQHWPGSTLLYLLWATVWRTRMLAIFNFQI